MVKMRNFNQIKKIIEQHREELENKFKLKTIAVFDSYVRSEQKEKIDNDIL